MICRALRARWRARKLKRPGNGLLRLSTYIAKKELE